MPSYVVSFELCRAKPPVDFTLALPKWITFRDIHGLIQRLMGWEDSHLHEFEILGSSTYITADCDEEEFEEGIPESCAKLSDYEGKEIIYTYDFGDNWAIRMKFLNECEEDLEHPVLRKYRGTPPPEDSGGVWSYNTVMEGKKSESMSDAEVSAINDELAKVAFGRRKEYAPPVSVPTSALFNLPSAVAICADHELYLDTATGKVYSTDACGYFPVADCTEGMIRIPPEIQADYCKEFDAYLEERPEEQPRGITEIDAWDEGLAQFALNFAYAVATKSLKLVMEPISFRDGYIYTLLMETCILTPRCPLCGGHLANMCEDTEHTILEAFGKMHPFSIDCVGCGKTFMMRYHYFFDQPVIIDGYSCSFSSLNGMLSLISHLEGDRWRSALITGLNRLGCYDKAIEASMMFKESPQVSAAAVATLYPCGIIDDVECRRILERAERNDDKNVNAVIGAITGQLCNADRALLGELDPWALIQISKVTHDRAVSEAICRRLLERIDWNAGDRTVFLYEEYCRLCVQSGTVPEDTLFEPWNSTETREEVLRYRKSVSALMKGDMDTAVKNFRGLCSFTFGSHRDCPEVVLRAAFAALIVHHSGYRYKGKDLIAYSVKWACISRNRGLLNDVLFDEYIGFMMPLALKDRSAADVSKILARNGLKGYVLPEAVSPEFDPSILPTLDSQYMYRGRNRVRL